MSYVVNAFACLVNIEIPGENMKDFVSNHTPVTGYKYQGDIFVWIQKGFLHLRSHSSIHAMNIHHEKYRHISQLLITG